ncbi:bifunctional riboflavin kinase/FAD synthetase [soil metagenome]
MPDSGLPPTVSGTVLTVGTFDGVHCGHRDVIERLVDKAAARGLPSLLVTFEPHPLEVVNPSAAPPLLTSHDEKLEILATCGLDYVALLPFTPTLASYGAEQFVEEILRGRFRMHELLVGHDHGFGKARAGDASVLRELGARDGFQVDVIEPVTFPDGRAISSTAIRRAIAGGDLQRAAAGLGRGYSVAGTVGRGEQRGRSLGYPTLNLVIPAGKLLPPEGVYAVRTETPRGSFGGMLSFGPRPTFGDARVSFEVYLMDASGDFYGDQVRVELVQRLRGVRAFASTAALVEQIRLDEAATRSALTLPPAVSNLPAAHGPGDEPDPATNNGPRHPVALNREPMASNQ